MKKGFTLIELLIVMVILGILVTVALPKYNASLERGRAMEALANLKAASGVMNTRYLINENAYTPTGLVDSDGYFTTGDYTKSVAFTLPRLVGWSDSTAEIKVDTLPEYDADGKLIAYNENGELKYIVCTFTEDEQKRCENIGAELDTIDGTNEYRIDFRF